MAMKVTAMNMRDESNPHKELHEDMAKLVAKHFSDKAEFIALIDSGEEDENKTRELISVISTDSPIGAINMASEFAKSIRRAMR